MGKITKDKRDIYYRLAKENEYRSRSAFKLLQIDQKFDFIKDSFFIVDLCAAPGGWSQVVSKKINSNNKDNFKIISVDLQEFSELKDVDQVIGDITKNTTFDKIMEKTEKNLINLVLSDCAPDISGLNEFDSYIQFQLILASLNISIRMLSEGGNFISKIFRGKYTPQILQILSHFFKTITIAKPKACRNASFESFLVCENFYIKEETKEIRIKKVELSDLILLNNLYNDDEEYEDLDKLGIKFIQVGDDEYDSDKTYDIVIDENKNNTFLEVLQKPINPPYKFYFDNLNNKIVDNTKK